MGKWMIFKILWETNDELNRKKIQAMRLNNSIGFALRSSKTVGNSISVSQPYGHYPERIKWIWNLKKKPKIH